jgi:hypothetical protein
MVIKKHSNHVKAPLKHKTILCHCIYQHSRYAYKQMNSHADDNEKISCSWNATSLQYPYLTYRLLRITINYTNVFTITKGV